MTLEDAWMAPSRVIGETVDELGAEGMESLGTNLAIGGAALEMWNDWQAAEDKREAQESAFKTALLERKRQFAHNLKMYKENARLSKESVIRGYRDTMRSINQHKVAAENEVSNIARESLQSQSEMASGQADRGVMGATQDLLLANIKANELRSIENVRLSQEWLETEKVSSMDEIHARGETRRMSMIPSPAPMPAVPTLAAGPNLGGQVLQGVGEALKARAAFGKATGRQAGE